MPLFDGISAFPITPTDVDGRADDPALGRLLDNLVRAQVQAIGLLGSTGGYAYLTPAERQRILEATIDRTAGSVPVIVGVGALRTDDSVTLARHATKTGADGLLLAPISYTPLTEDEVFRHFAAVAAASDLPVCIYNNPSTTHFSFSIGLLTRLADLPTIRAVKMPLPADGDFTADLTRLRGALPADFSIGYSGDWGAATSLLAGADGFFSVAAGLLPRQMQRLGRAAMTGNADLAQRLDADFQGLWSLFREFGSLRVMHAAADMLGLAIAPPPRPVLPMPETQTGRLRQAMVDIGAL